MPPSPPTLVFSNKSSPKSRSQAAAKEAELLAQIAALSEQNVFDQASIADLQAQVQTHDVQLAESATEMDEVKAAHEEAVQEQQQAETNHKAVITNLVSQVGDLQTNVAAAVTAKAEMAAQLATLQEEAEAERAHLTTKTNELERQLGQVTFAKEDLEAALAKEQEGHAAVQQKYVSLQTRSTEQHTELARLEAKLEEVTLSEQELAWQKEALQNKLAEQVGEEAAASTSKKATTQEQDEPQQARLLEEAQQQQQSLAAENEKLRATVDKLSVKLYKVVGFLDEMVQEQEAIISESSMPSQDSAEQPPATTPQEYGSIVDDSSSNHEHRQKLLTNVNGMKEQIIGVIDSVVDDLGKDDNEDEEEGHEVKP